MTATSKTKTHHATDDKSRPPYIRGVNLGGWLMLERFITPYLFAVTDCHLNGDLCWYPGQLSAPPPDHPAYQVCNLYTCQPHLRAVHGGQDYQPNAVDYPLDEYTLAQAFANNRRAGQDWLNMHFEHFVSKQDVVDIKAAGITHIRVPLPHWILGDGEPWIVGDRWKYFVRFCTWCRQVGLQVWPDIHSAPGSQNGFDNSGRAMPAITCQNWSNEPAHVQQSLQIIQDITSRIVADGLNDVVTGFGLLNEPFKDCNVAVYKQFLEQGLDIVRHTLGPHTAVYVSDLFLAKKFNHWWLDPERYNQTYLDSHYYHVFSQKPRELSPRQHIAYVCQNEYRDAISCCYQDLIKTVPSKGVSRIVGEWSAATDTLPVAMLLSVMQGIAINGTAPHFDRQLSAPRQDFLKHFMQAQIVAYEAADAGTSAGWFYWTAKMEGGAFAEWDFLRAVREGWMPRLPNDTVTPSQDLYGTCYDIIFRTNDSMDIIHEFPDPSTLPEGTWVGPDIDDDVVISHGDSLLNVNGHYIQPEHHREERIIKNVVLGVIAVFFGLALVRIVVKKYHGRKGQYTEIRTVEV